jgi:hypothetical protein
VDTHDYDPGEITVNESAAGCFCRSLCAQMNPLQVVYALNEVKDLPWNVCDGRRRRPETDVEALVHSLGLRSRFTFPAG